MSINVGDIVRIKSRNEIIEAGNRDPGNMSEFSCIIRFYTGNEHAIVTGTDSRSCGDVVIIATREGRYYMLKEHVETVISRNDFGSYADNNDIKIGQILDIGSDNPIIREVIRNIVPMDNSTSTTDKILREDTILISRSDRYASPTVNSWGFESIEVSMIANGGRATFVRIPVAIIKGIKENVEFDPIADVVLECNRCNSRYTARYNLITEMTIDVDNEDNGLCPECRKRRFVTPYHRLTPKLKFGNTDHDADPDLYLGFELEVARGGERNSVAAKVMDLMNENEPTVYCSHDSSINCGFEIISHPLTMEKHRDNKELYEKLFKMLVHEGYRSHDDSSCGLHVHFSRAYFDKYEGSIDRLIFIMNKFWDDIVLFSRKTQDAIERYARTLSGWDRDEFIERWDKSGDHDGHYYALNLVNEHTIEFRIWRGTLKLSTFMLTMEATYNMIQAAAHKTLAELDDMKFEDFLDDAGKRYYQIKKDALEFGLGENVEA